MSLSFAGFTKMEVIEANGKFVDSAFSFTQLVPSDVDMYSAPSLEPV
jgi:hypothetical protein